MRHAQIVVGVKGHGKSTYCSMMSNMAESQGRGMKVVNLDPAADVLPYPDTIIADIRNNVSFNDFKEVGSSIGGGLELVLKYVVDNPDWLFGAIGEIGVDGDSILFDCPGDTDFHPHLNILEVFGALLLAKDFRVCVIFIQDARLAMDGYSFISTCFTPLISYMSISVPHISIYMKVDMLPDEDKSKLLLFITSDIRDVLRYENNKHPAPDKRLVQVAESAVMMLDGHCLVQRKQFLLDIREEQEVQGLLVQVLALVDDCFANLDEED